MRRNASFRFDLTGSRGGCVALSAELERLSFSLRASELDITAFVSIRDRDNRMWNVFLLSFSVLGKIWHAILGMLDDEQQMISSLHSDATNPTRFRRMHSFITYEVDDDGSKTQDVVIVYGITLTEFVVKFRYGTPFGFDVRIMKFLFQFSRGCLNVLRKIIIIWE